MVRLPSLPCPQEGLGVFLLYEEVGKCADSATRSLTSYAPQNCIVPSYALVMVGGFAIPWCGGKLTVAPGHLVSDNGYYLPSRFWPTFECQPGPDLE